MILIDDLCPRLTEDPSVYKHKWNRSAGDDQIWLFESTNKVTVKFVRNLHSTVSCEEQKYLNQFLRSPNAFT